MEYKYFRAAVFLWFLSLIAIIVYHEKSETKSDIVSGAVNTAIIENIHHEEEKCDESCEVKFTEKVEEIVVTEEPKEEKQEEKQEVNDEELEMLACLIYQEAGGDAVCDECRYRVADVVLNRINDKRFPDTMYEVLTQKKQYGMMHYTGIKWPERASNVNEKHAVERAYNTANDVLSGNHSELYDNGYIWQAEFEQGSSGFWHCGIYFGK